MPYGVIPLGFLNAGIDPSWSVVSAPSSCPYCGSRVEEEDSCRNCGAPSSVDMHPDSPYDAGVIGRGSGRKDQESP